MPCARAPETVSVRQTTATIPKPLKESSCAGPTLSEMVGDCRPAAECRVCVGRREAGLVVVSARSTAATKSARRLAGNRGQWEDPPGSAHFRVNVRRGARVMRSHEGHLTAADTSSRVSSWRTELRRAAGRRRPARLRRGAPPASSAERPGQAGREPREARPAEPPARRCPKPPRRPCTADGVEVGERPALRLLCPGAPLRGPALGCHK